jgi:hypothetical protein
MNYKMRLIVHHVTYTTSPDVSAAKDKCHNLQHIIKDVTTHGITVFMHVCRDD